MTLGILFSGQGAQKSKMELDFCEDTLFAEVLKLESTLLCSLYGEQRNETSFLRYHRGIFL